MILLLTSVLLVILLSRVLEELIKIPFALALILLSYILHLSFPAVFTSLGENFDEILHLMLPVILLPGLLNLTVEEIRRYIWTFLYLAVFAVIASIAIATVITPYLLPEYAFTAGMLIALFTMLMATDVITVSSLFSRFSLPSKMKIYAEGESLFNDVTALIIFYIIAMPLLTEGHVSLLELNVAVFQVIIFSIMLGLAACGLGYLALKLIKNAVEQFIIIYLVAILSFVLAEHWHVSGILATVSAVIGLKYITTREIVAYSIDDKHSDHFKDPRSYFEMVVELIKRVPALTPRGFIAYKKEAHYLGIFANAIIFISMASLLEISRIAEFWQEILIVFVLTTLIRGMFIFPFISYRKLPTRWATVLTLAGMKGGLAIIMAHSLPDSFIYREMFEMIVFGNVLLTIFLYSFLIMAYLYRNHERFELDRIRQEQESDLNILARQFQQVIEKHPVTRLYIPSIFEEIIDNELSRATRYGMDLALVIVNFNHTAENDSAPSTDLTMLAEIVRNETRTNDLTGHLDSHTLGAVTTNTDAAGAAILVGRIRKQIIERGISAHIQIGIADFEQGDNSELLIAKARAAL
jgi:CPA1 family monovalent cation:H+ antiporter